jgi:Mg-chelatase subunit ChlD
MRRGGFGGAAAFGLLLALARADLAPEEWEAARKEAALLAAQAGELERKLDLVHVLGREDSARAARLLLDLAEPASARQHDLSGRVAKASEEFARIDRQLRKKHGVDAALDEDPRWRKRRETLVGLRQELSAESAVLDAIGSAFATIRTREGVAVLLDAARLPSSEVRRGALEALLGQPGESHVDAILGLLPAAPVRVLDWIGARRVRKGLDAAASCLLAEESAVARAAVAALRALDDPRAVPPLVAARRKASGLLAEEIELALFHFTGRQFQGAGADAMWEGWWRAEGEEWLRTAGTERHAGAVRRGDTDFYGIETRSERIVFVLDRSGSMEESGKLATAKGHLERTIRGLAPGVKFAVVFYNQEARAWQKPPLMVPATPDQKRKAIAWFATLPPQGATAMFPALAEALRYAKVGGGASPTDPKGADTIFLLTDGAPTDADGKALADDAREAAIRAFLEANRELKCVVHAIGVGPDHNVELMMRLARETGGVYKAVGTE